VTGLVTSRVQDCYYTLTVCTVPTVRQYNTQYISKETRRVLHVEQELLTLQEQKLPILPEHLSSPPIFIIGV